MRFWYWSEKRCLPIMATVQRARHCALVGVGVVVVPAKEKQRLPAEALSLGDLSLAFIHRHENHTGAAPAALP